MERAAGPPSPKRLLWTTWAGTQPGAGEKVPAMPRCLSPHNTYEEQKGQATTNHTNLKPAKRTTQGKGKRQKLSGQRAGDRSEARRTEDVTKWGMGERPLLSCQASV